MVSTFRTKFSLISIVVCLIRHAAGATRFFSNPVRSFHKSYDSTFDLQKAMLTPKCATGTPPMRKTALRQLTDNARQFGAGPLFNQILPLLMEKSLEDQERHLLVKVIDRVLYKLDDLVRPYVHKILVVIEPLLIDQDYYARVEGREIISNLSKSAGLATMISTMRPDIGSSLIHPPKARQC